MQEKLIFSNDVDGTDFDRSGSTFSILKNISTGCFQTVFIIMLRITFSLESLRKQNRPIQLGYKTLLYYTHLTCLLKIMI